VLQHLTDPRRAVAEMARVTRPGGRIAALEFDLGTVFLDHPDRELSDAIRASFISAAVQRSVGHQVPRLFVEAGLTYVETAPRVIPSGPDFFRLLLGYHVNERCDGGVIAPERATRWWTAMDDAAASGHFTGGGTAFVVCGTIN
jgi:SAM-dependent methyltransferase